MTEVLHLLMTTFKSFENFVTRLFNSIPWLRLKNKSARIQYSVLAGLVMAIIVHIVYLLYIPHLEKYNTWDIIEKNNPAYQFSNPAKETAISKSSDPLFSLKVCRFNLSDGLVHLYAEGTTSFWSLSIYDRSGLNLYSINDRTTPNDMLDLVLGNPAQIMQAKQANLESIANSVLVSENIEEGFVILRSYNGQDIIKQTTFLDNALCELLAK